MRRVRRLLRWLRIEDRTGKLSLTTVAFAAAMYCVLAGKQFSGADVGAFVAAIVAHRHREAQDQVAPIAAPEGAPAAP